MVAAGLAVLLSSSLAHAQDDTASCALGYANDSSQTRIDACSRVIQNGLRVGKGFEISWAYTSRGSLYEKTGRKNLAFVDYSDAIRFNKNEPYAYANRGSLYFDDQDYDMALADFNSQLAVDAQVALENKLGIANAYNGIGRVHVARKEYAKAVAMFTNAIYSRPTDAPYWSNRGIAFKALKDYDSAVADFNKALELTPNAADYWRRGSALQLMERWNDAVLDYAKAAQMQAENGAYHNSHAWALFKTGKAAEALPVAQKALALLTNDANSIDTLAHVYEALGRRDDAVTQYRRALSINPNLQESKDGLKRLGVE